MRASASSAAATLRAGRPADWYRFWVESSVGLLGDPSRIRHWAEPPIDIGAELDEAKATGVARIVCGFLPDELDWPGFGGDWRQAYWSARSVFVPYLLPAPRSLTTTTSDSILYITDGPDGGAQSERAVAHAVAVAVSGELIEIAASLVSPDELSASVARSSLVVNAVRDWALGFAIDELAARVGRRVVRLAQPGYSPLRYALLGQALIEPGTATMPLLRPLLATMLEPARSVTAAVAAAPWFGDSGAAARWSRLTTWNAFRDFWAPVHWSRMQPGPFDRAASWLNRPAAWAMLDAVLASREFPAVAAERAIATMTSWLVAEQRAENGGTVRGWGLSRWVLRHPEWIETYRKASGEGREAKAALARWIRRGLEFLPPQAQIFQAMRAASWAVKRDELAGQWPASLVLAWGEAWPRVSGILAAATEIAPVVQVSCAESCWTALASKHPVDATVVEDAALWSRSFGGAAPALRALAAARVRRWSIAVPAWREARARLGIAARQQGLARLLRLVHADAKSVPVVLGSLARDDAARLRGFVFDLVAEWNLRRKWDLWRIQRRRDVAGELDIALDMLREFTTNRDGVTATAWRLRALLAALAGELAEANAALSELARLDSRVAEGAFSVAMAFWLGGLAEEARRLAVAWPPQSEERPVLLFLRAAVAQLMGDEAGSAEAILRLRREAPDYFTDPTAADARWAYLGAVYKDAGHSAADRVRAIARTAMPGSERLIDDVAGSGRQLPPGWLELLSE